MAKNKSVNNIGLDYLNSIYTNTEIVTENPEPIYLLHRNTMKTFLYEKKENLWCVDKLFSIGGICLTFWISLLTSSFDDIENKKHQIIIEGSIIKGMFIICAIIFSVWTLYRLWRIIYNRKSLSIDNICDELEKNISVIRPKNEFEGIIQTDKTGSEKEALPLNSNETN